MNLKPMPGMVIIQPEEMEGIKGTRLILPDSAKEKSLGCGLCLTGEHKDKKVWYKRYSGEEIIHEGETYEFVYEEDLIAEAMI